MNHIFLEDLPLDDLIATITGGKDEPYFIDTIHSSNMLLTNYEFCIASAKTKFQASELREAIIKINKVFEQKSQMIDLAYDIFERKRFYSLKDAEYVLQATTVEQLKAISDKI